MGESQQHLLDLTLASLYDTVIDDSCWAVAIGNLAAIFDASTAAMFDYDFLRQTASDVRAYGFDTTVIGLYQSYYHLLDPGRERGMRAAVGEWLADEQMLDLHSRRDQEYVQDFALRVGIGRVAGFKVSGNGERCTYLGLQRSPGADRFGDSARRLHLAIEPHLRRVAQMRAKFDSLAASNALAAACLDRIQAGVLVVDKTRRVHLANERAVQLLKTGADPTIRKAHVASTQPALNDQLDRAIASACGERGIGGAVHATQPTSGETRLLMVLPIPAHHDLAAVGPEPVALIVITDPNAEHLPKNVYQALFSLTSAEAELLGALARGVALAAWAARRRVSMATVRSQLRSLFEKTRTDSQARLVALVKAMPSVR